MNYSNKRNAYKERRYALVGFFMLVVLIYISRLFYLQILDNKTKIVAENSSTRVETIYPDRGLILDRNGEVLAFNEVVYDLLVTPAQVNNFDTTALIHILNVDTENFIKRYKKLRRYRYRVPSRIEKQLSSKTYARLQEVMHKFPGFHVQTKTSRKYPKPIAAHLLGYVREVSQREIDAKPYYQMGDQIGIKGIEQAYEKFLRGEKGRKIFLVDKFNRKIEPYKNGKLDKQPRVGSNITTSLDMNLQEYGEKLMKGKIGSIVAIEPSSGEILALVSSPTFDPNLLVGRQLGKNYRKLNRSKLLPLFNRALMAQYPPASTFKLIIALIGLQEKIISPDSHYPCSSGYVVGNFRLGCHHTHSMALEEGIQRSCNAYFCNVFRKILDQEEYDNISSTYTLWRNHVLSFGIGKKLGSDLQGELTGSVPTASFFNKKLGKNKWKSLQLISMGIGQGELLVTPFQMTNMTAAIANRGHYITPHIVKRIEDSDTIQKKFSHLNHVTISPAHFDAVINGMEKVLTPEGTAASSKVPGVVVCGKTGTAENPHGQNHSIFTAFAPKNNPKIAISVYVENAGYGSTWAAPIAKLMLEKYLNDSISSKAAEQRIIKENLIPEIYKENPDSSKILKFRKRRR